MSFSTFKKLKPRSVLPFTSHKFRECLCEYCANVDLKLQAIDRHSTPDLHISDRYRASRITLCPKQAEREYLKACLDRKCCFCGTGKLQHHFQPLLEDPDQCSKPVSWFQWENVKTGTLTCLRKVKKESTFEGLVETLRKDLDTFSYHLFNARWQWQQYKEVSANVPQNTVVLCLDFAENFACHPQDAPQGCHWTNTQVTLHPIVASYACSQCEEGHSLTVTDTIMFLSPDLRHDSHAVQHFIRKAIQLLQSEGIQFSNVTVFSDGAPTQYKNRVNFVDCSFAQADLGVTTERHFFGSRHGKGPCDREIGVIKKAVNRAVAARQADVASAEEVFSLCSDRLSLPRPGHGESQSQPHKTALSSCFSRSNRQSKGET